LDLALVCLLLVLSSVGSVASWSNGGYSADPSHPNYGTHDWIAQHALDWLPDNEKQYILDNLALYLYGTELPDNNQAPDGIGDTINHHVYYRSDNSLQEDNSAVRASTEFSNALTFLKEGRYADAAKTAGIMSHYIVDLAVFGHVMGSGTDWGAETHHSDYENYVNDRTSSYSSTFDTYLSFDGRLDVISAYDAALQLAYNTTFGVGGNLTCVWMDRNYNWSDPAFRDRVGQSLNLAVNYLADVLHTLYIEAQITQTSTTTNILINEVEQNPPGADEGYEWLELYNPTSNTVDIGNWTLSTTAGATVTFTIPPGTSIEAGGYYVYTHGSQWLDNKNESVILRDATGNEVDRTPTLSDTYNDGRSWQRYPNGKDTNSASDWSFRSSTMGASNGGETKTPISDTTNPVISSITPADGSTLNSTTLTISASYYDDVAINTTSVNLKVDGVSVTPTALSATKVEYSATFTEGTHSVSLTIKDTSGNTATATWSFTVRISSPQQGSRCLIATATYGSELAPQVQFLRDFRETLALKTFAGSSFMAVFNAWYYSWSPPVAASIAPDPTIKAIMRVILEPLLYILQLSVTTFSLFAFNGELAIVMAGLVASALIGLVYFMPVTTIILIMITRLCGSWAIPKPGRIKFLVILWAVGTLLMFAGELTLFSPLMMFATGAFVVLTITIVTGFVSLKIAELAKRVR
jgi:hypothetical protein